MHITHIELKKIREMYRLSLKEMSQLLGVHFTLLSMIENGSRNLTNAVRAQLIDAFDLTDDKLERILRLCEEFTMPGGSVR